MRSKHENEVPKVLVDKEGFRGMTAQYALTRDDGCPNYATRLMTFQPGGHTSLHAHREEHEFYFLEGTPVFVDHQGRETELAPGDFLYVEPDEPHQIKNGGETVMRMICTIPILPGGDGKCTVGAAGPQCQAKGACSN